MNHKDLVERSQSCSLSNFPVLFSCEENLVLFCESSPACSVFFLLFFIFFIDKEVTISKIFFFIKNELNDSILLIKYTNKKIPIKNMAWIFLYFYINNIRYSLLNMVFIIIIIIIYKI